MWWHTRRNGRVHLNRRGRQFSRLLAAEVCAFSGSNTGYTMFRGRVKSTGYPLHSPVSPLLPIPRVTVCHHISTGLYLAWNVHAPYCHLWPARLYHNIPHYLKKDKIFKINIESKICSNFLYNCCPKHFWFKKEFSEICSKLYIGLHIKYPIFFSDFNETWIFSTYFG
jgi:hypothetical protein